MSSIILEARRNLCIIQASQLQAAKLRLRLFQCRTGYSTYWEEESKDGGDAEKVGLRWTSQLRTSYVECSNTCEGVAFRKCGMAVRG